MAIPPIIKGRVWSEYLFDNDGALNAVSRLNELAGLDKLNTAAATDQSVITHSLYAPQCASDEAREQVRKHLDSGVLHELTRKMVANYFNPISAEDYTYHGFHPVILGACAMSLGCSTLYTAPGYKMFFKTYKDMLVGIFECVPLMDGAKEQMKKALLDADGFKPGSPLDFSTFARSSALSASAKADPCLALLHGGLPHGYDSKRKIEPIVGQFEHVIGPCDKEDMEYPDDDLCGHCGRKPRKPLTCRRCRDQKYCSKLCQRVDYERHEVVCRTPEDAKVMEDYREAFINVFYSSLESMMGSGFSGRKKK
ncbi:hypothetical protein Q7P37_007951 [Cladosporium fusiforme]